MEEDSSKEMKFTPNLEKSEEVLVLASDTKPKKKDTIIQKSSEVGSEENEDDDSSNEDSDSDLSDLEYACKVCSKTFSGFVPLRQHEKSGKHEKEIKKKKREKMLQKKLTTGEEVLEEKDDYLVFVKKPYGVCQPCRKQFTGPEAYDKHLQSKSHKMKVMEKEFLDQVREKGEITNESIQKFIKDKQSAMKSAINEKEYDDYQALLESFQESLSTKKSDDNDSDDERAGEYECETCEKVFSGFVPYSQHIISKVHAKTVKRKEAINKMMHKSLQSAHCMNAPNSSGPRDLSPLEVDNDTITCTLCSMAFSGPENALTHLKSRGHSKKLKAKMWKLSRKQSSKSFSSDTGSEGSFTSRNNSLSDKLLENEDDNVISKEAEKSDLDETGRASDASEFHKEEEMKTGHFEKPDLRGFDQDAVVDSGKASEQNNQEFTSYDRYKKYKKIMNESDKVL